LRVSPVDIRTSVLLIDENLNDRPISQALRLVDYNAKSVTEEFGQGVNDPMLIQWLGLQGGIWVTADEKAKRTHAHEINSAGISVLWIRRDKKLGMSKKAQLLLILWIIDDILKEVYRRKTPVKFLAYYHGVKPKYEILSNS